VIARIEPERIGEVAAELMNRGEFVTMGCFVGHLERPAILAALEAMGDSALLQTAFVLENKDSVQELVALLPEPRLQRVIDAATAEGLWPETLGLLAYLDETQRRRMIGTASGRGEDVLSGLIEAADAEAMWDVVLPLTTLMSSEQLERFAALASLQRPGVLEAIVDVAVEDDELWAQLLPLVARLPEACQARVVARVRALPVDHAALLDRARAAGLEDQLGPLESALGA
jgi:hypothetical protein